jgi:hypothetical protein
VENKDIFSESEREIFDKAIEYKDKKIINSESIHGFIEGAMWMRSKYEEIQNTNIQKEEK